MPKMKPQTKTYSDIYKLYHKKINPNVSYDTFKTILFEFNKAAMKEIIEKANILSLYSNLGDIFVTKVYRTFRKLRVDWGNSIKDKETGKYTHLVYHVDQYYLRFYWKKTFKQFNTKNSQIYKFKVAEGTFRGPNNHVSNLMKANEANSLLHLKYVVMQKVKDIQALDIVTGAVKHTFKSYMEIKDMYPSFQPANIKRVLNNINATAYGFKWIINYE